MNDTNPFEPSSDSVKRSSLEEHLDSPIQEVAHDSAADSDAISINPSANVHDNNTIQQHLKLRLPRYSYHCATWSGGTR